MPSPDPQDAKQLLRRKILAKRRSLSPQALQQASLAIAHRLFQLPAWKQACGIHCFLSLPHEPSTLPIWQAASPEKTCFAPVQLPQHQLGAAPWNPRQPLVQAAFGVLEPPPPPQGHQPLSPSQAAAIDIVIVPGIAFDQQRQRLGYGKGFYDRFITQLKALKKSPPTLIGLALELQCLPTLPSEPHDIPLDIILTPSFSIPPGC